MLIWPPKKQVQEEGFNDIVLVMSQGQLGTIQGVRHFKQAPTTQTGAKETGVLPIFRTVGLNPVIGLFKMKGYFQIPAEGFHRPGSGTGKTHIQVNGDQFIGFGDPTETFPQQP